MILTNTGNCHSRNVAVSIWSAPAQATVTGSRSYKVSHQSETPSPVMIWVHLHRRYHWRQEYRIHFVLVSIRKCKTSANVVATILSILTASRATCIPAYMVAHFLWHTNIAVTYNLFDTCSWAVAEHQAGLVDSSIKFEALNFFNPSKCWEGHCTSSSETM